MDMLQALVLAIMDAPDRRSALGGIVKETCVRAGWDYGEAWVVEADQEGNKDHLRLATSWHTGTLELESFASYSRNLTIESDGPLAGRAWATHAPVWIKSLKDEPKFRRGALASRVGLVAGFAMPLFTEQSMITVLTFFMTASEERDEEFINALSQSGPMLGALMERKPDGMGAGTGLTGPELIDENLRLSQALLSNLVNSAMDAIISIDESQRITLFNRAAEQMFRCSAEEAIGQSLDRFIPARLQEAHRDLVAEFGETESVAGLRPHRPVVGLRATGEEFPLESSVSHTTVGGRKVFTAILRDITERQRTEEARRAQVAAEQANQAKSEFLSRMSHELRTPLNSIIGFSDLLNMEGLAPRQRENVGYIRQAGQHLLQLVNEVLDITSIESGAVNFSLEPVELNDVINEAIDLVRPLAATRFVQFRLEPMQPDLYVQADRQRLKQILLNLLSNAVKYNVESGLVTLTVDADDDGPIGVSVSDTGMGIDPGKMSKLFMPFERLGAERLGAEGTGLGLALVKHLVEAMNGTIGVESTPGKGSTFWVELPRTQAQVMPLRKLGTAPIDTSSLPGYTSTILYVEDNLSNIRLVERILEHRQGIRLLSSMQGRLALDIARDHKPDVILLDLHLPDITGQDVLQALKSDATTHDIPVVIISADATQGTLERLIAAGAHSYLTKPLEVRRFLRVLDETLTSTR